LRVSEGNTWQEAFLKVLPERKNARPIVSPTPTVQSKKDGSQESKPIVNDAMPVDTSNAVLVNVNNTIPVDVNNTVSIVCAVNNTVTVVKDVCDKESDSNPEYNANSKGILNENSCIT